MSFLRNRSLNVVFGAVLFNLVCELWVHGATGFLNPVLTGSLIVLYSTYFLMLEDLVVRYRLGDAHVLLAGIVFGLWHETFTTGSVFAPGSPLGVNPVVVVLASVFWWGAMQSVAGLYFANRFLGVRDWGHRRMGKLSWGLCLLFSLQAAQTIFSMKGSSPVGYAVSLSLLALTVIVFIYTKKPVSPNAFQRSRPLDILVGLHVVLCLGIGLTVGSRTNQVAQIAFVVWSFVFGAAVGLIRWRTRTAISV
jgi:hypothetical protein